VKAHQELERLTVDRETAHFQQGLSLRYAELVYYGLWFAPLREALDGFFNVAPAARHRRCRLETVEGHAQRYETRFSFLAISRADLASFTMGRYNPKDAEAVHQFVCVARDRAPKAKAEGRQTISRAYSGAAAAAPLTKKC